ncbi:MAG: hypothetical protein J5685_11420 [Clostridiales bacterium]|nr:hypothetical protein [Clostridiales bacterium]
MHDLFMTVLSMSLTGSIVIGVVLLARLFMRRLPKKYTYLLWLIVAFRLLCPISLQSSFSIFNILPLKSASVVEVSSEAHEAQVIQTVPAVNTADMATGEPQPQTVTAASKATDKTYVLASVWALTAVMLGSYCVYRYIKVKKQISGAVPEARSVYSGHMIDSPFVFGIIKPRIYLPSRLSPEEREYLILHELTHIRRGDPVFKLIGIIILVVHWFNPLVWVSYILFCRDMEMSCDEAVIAKLGDRVKADYSMSLISFARMDDGQKFIVAPISFAKKITGGSEVKMRITNVLGYKGHSRLTGFLAIVLVLCIASVCIFNARTRADEDNDTEVQVAEVTETSATSAVETEEAPTAAPVQTAESSGTTEDSQPVQTEESTGATERSADSADLLEAFGQVQVTVTGSTESSREIVLSDGSVVTVPEGFDPETYRSRVEELLSGDVFTGGPVIESDDSAEEWLISHGFSGDDLGLEDEWSDDDVLYPDVQICVSGEVISIGEIVNSDAPT